MVIIVCFLATSGVKRKKSCTNVCAGDLVLLLETPTEGRRNYPKALVVETYPDSRGHVHIVKLKLSDGHMIEQDI